MYPTHTALGISPCQCLFFHFLMQRPWVQIPLKPRKHFLGLLCYCLNCNRNCDDHIFISFVCRSAVHIIFIYMFLVEINNYTASQNDFNLVLLFIPSLCQVFIVIIKCNNNIVNRGEKNENSIHS